MDNILIYVVYICIFIIVWVCFRKPKDYIISYVVGIISDAPKHIGNK